MTDKELIRALRICPKCQLYEYGDRGVDMKEHAADRLEELLAENERLKTQIPNRRKLRGWSE